MKTNNSAACSSPLIGNLVGGHVVTNIANVQPPYGSNQIVWLVPICKAHNHHTNVAVMRANPGTTGVWLDNYHQ